jgi:hypothetical protein
MRRLTTEAAACGLAAAAIAALALPGNRYGLAATVVMLGNAATVLVAGRAALLFQGPAGLLALAPFVRDADWVVALDLIGACVLVAFAAGHAATAPAMRAAISRALRGLLPGVPALIAPLAYAVGGDRARGAVPLLRGLALAAILLIVFGGQFVSADAAFAEVVDQIPVPDWSLGTLPDRGLVFVLVGSLAGALALTAAAPVTAAGARPVRARLQPAEWIPALALLDLLFAAFVAVQLAVLFGGHDHVLETTGLTYAEYARKGFVELIVAAALTLAVVGVAAKRAARENKTQERALLVLSGILFALTLVVLASALRRLGLYEDAFGFTRARLFAHGTILWLGASFVLVATFAALDRTKDLARAVVLVTAGGLIAATAANPDGMIAARNADRFAATGRIDTSYLANLSADAVPRLAKLPPGVRACVLAGDLGRDGLAEANIARSRARRVLAGLPPSRCTR